MSVPSKMLEVQRHTHGQQARCKNLLKKLKTIQLEELEEYGDDQLETVVKVIADSKDVYLTEAAVPEFLQRKKPSPLVDEYEETPPQNALPPPPIDSKAGLQKIQDMSQMMKSNIKETILSTVMIGKDDNDTDSCSDYEDEVESFASFNFNRGDINYNGYLPVGTNPVTRWARMRHEILTRFVWLQDALRNIHSRLKQQDELLRYIKLIKPPLKFDETPGIRKPAVVCTFPDLKDATIQIYREDAEPLLGKSNTTAATATKINSKPPNVCDKSESTAMASAIIGNMVRDERETRSDNRGVGVVGGGLESLQLRVMDSPDATATARRCIPLESYRQRKMFQLGGIHNVMGKQVKQPSAVCSCYGRTELCASCSGRSDKVKRVRTGVMTKTMASALLDHSYHMVLSTSDEKPLRLLTESSFKTEEWNKSLKKKHLVSGKPVKENQDRLSEPEDERQFDSRSKVRLLPVYSYKPEKTAKKLSAKKPKRQSFDKIDKKTIKEVKKTRKRRRHSDDEDEEEAEDVDMSWTPKKANTSIGQEFKKRRMDEKYDIDHIVIPYSIAAATRVEKIEYKEIMIPSWRNNRIEPLKRAASRSKKRLETEDDVEDISEESIVARHYRSEIDEKKRFLSAMNKLSNRRTRRSESKGSKAEGSEFSMPASPLPEINEAVPVKVDEVTPSFGAPNHISAEDASLAVTALKISTPGGSSRRRTISICKAEDDDEEELGWTPFEPRQFPLEDDEYAEMVKDMEAAYAESERQDLEPDLSVTIKQEVIEEELSELESEVDDPDWRENDDPKSVHNGANGAKGANYQGSKVTRRSGKL